MDLRTRHLPYIIVNLSETLCKTKIVRTDNDKNPRVASKESVESAEGESPSDTMFKPLLIELNFDQVTYAVVTVSLNILNDYFKAKNQLNDWSSFSIELAIALSLIVRPFPSNFTTAW